MKVHLLKAVFTVFGVGEAHDFDSGAGMDLFQNITVPVGATLFVTLQWDSPFFSVSGAPGSANDFRHLPYR